MFILLAAMPSALGANPFEGRDSDIGATAIVDIAPEELYKQIFDFRVQEEIFPVDCVQDWVHGPVTRGEKARTRVTYKVRSWRRRMTVKFTAARYPQYIRQEGEGRKGFYTQWEFNPAEDGSGTKVSVKSYLNAPPWPFRRLYYDKIQPDWRACYEKALLRLPEVIQ